MERIITGFIAALRERGVRVSPGEGLDAVHALAVGGLSGRASVRSLLRLTLVKNAGDIPLFEEVFERFFSRDQASPRGADPFELMGALIHIVEGEHFEAAGRGEREKDDPLLLIDGEVTAEELENLLGMEESDDADGPEIQVQLDGARGRKEAPSPSYYDMRNVPTIAYAPGGAKVRSEPFTPEELADMQEVVCRMLVRIRKDAKRMREQENRGRLHVVRTIQKNYRHGMIPFLRVLRRKRPEKPRLVVLCDVSYSVSHATRFMLLLLHTLQNRVMDVRSFVFNREVVEITDRLRTMPVNCLLDTIETGDVVNLDDNSDYGNVFSRFTERHLEGMRGKPAVIIMGDGRNNYNEANEWALEEIREKAGYMLWLTPEERDLWRRGDCLIEHYGSYCDRVETVGDTDRLGLIVEELFRTLYDHDDTRLWKGRRTAPAEEEPVDYRDYYTRGGSGTAPAFDPETRRRW
ncbi:MAG TPA: VWA domain-containing protein [Desulfuromonadaceae bacterium]